MAPKVAVVIPCFNYGAYVTEAVHSVLVQDIDVELVVVDDGSTDPMTLEVLESLKAMGIRVLRQANGGVSSARNNGIRSTSAPYVVCLDADDMISPSYCSACLMVIESRPEVGFVYSTTRVFGTQDRRWSNLEYSGLALLVDNYVPYSAMFRRKVWEEVGGFDENITLGYEDWDFWLSVIGKGWKGFHVPQELFLYRKHGASRLTSSNQQRKKFKRFLRNKHRELYSLDHIITEFKQNPWQVNQTARALFNEYFLRPAVKSLIKIKR